jgi:flagellar basal-body rod protein FlgB
MISDLTLRSLHASLHGLDARRRAAEDNVANVETPGFRAHRVDFEASLRDAISDGRPLSTRIDATASSEPSRLNGNNVRIGDEMVGLTETALRQQLVVEAMNGKYRVLRTAIGNG